MQGHLSLLFPISRRRRRALFSLRLASICGLLTPLVFWIAVYIVGFLQTEYHPLADTISKMGRIGRPYAMIVNAILVITGMLIAIFATGIRDGRSPKALSPGKLLTGFGLLGLAGAGLLPCDEICVGTSPANITHTMAVAAGFISLQLALLQFANRGDRHQFWVNFPETSLAVFWAGMVSLMAFILGRWGFVPWLDSFAGLSEKVYLGLLFLFIFSMASHLNRDKG